MDLKGIIDTIVELGMCRKYLRMYPSGHDQVKQSVNRAHQILQRSIGTHQHLRIGVVGETFLIGTYLFDPKNALCRQFALALKNLGITMVTFIRGVGRDDLLKFLRLVAGNADTIVAQGGIVAAASKVGIRRVRLNTVDYSKFELTEEHLPEEGKESAGEHSLWQDFVVHLSWGTLAKPGEGTDAAKAGQVLPSALAQALNDNRLDVATARRVYEETLQSHMNTIGPGAVSAPVSRDIAQLDVLFRELNPKLKAQFLDITLDCCGLQGESSLAEALLSGLSYSHVIEMMRRANAQGRELSPSLMHLVRKVANIRNMSNLCTPPPEDIPALSAGSTADENELQKLFEPEEYEKYVPTDYDALLGDLSESQASGEGETSGEFVLDDYLTSLDEPALSCQISRLLLAFMSMNIGAGEYGVYAGKLVVLAETLLDAGKFDLLTEIVDSLERDARLNIDPGIRSVAAETRERFRDPHFASQAVSSFLYQVAEGDRDGQDFLIALGPVVVPDAVNYYARPERSDAEQAALLPVLVAHRREAAIEALDRIRDPRPEFVRHLLSLLRLLDYREAAQQLRTFISHPSLDVRMEVLETLLAFGDPMAIVFLRRALHSPRADVSSKAVSLSGKYKVADMVPDLIEIIKPRILFPSDFSRYEEVIVALGRIGDPQAIPVLEKIAKATWTFASEQLEQLKVVLFKSLDAYPYEDLEDLLNIGLRAPDEHIRAASRWVVMCGQRRSGEQVSGETPGKQQERDGAR
ncbi:MAG TPA: HEAT repeat domain-containing protein [Dissulfurispiraceae bacterium]|nr:HEAT repeat domain-containing protein [Dissulfurispiraceae bacterium]